MAVVPDFVVKLLRRAVFKPATRRGFAAPVGALYSIDGASCCVSR